MREIGQMSGRVGAGQVTAGIGLIGWILLSLGGLSGCVSSGGLGTGAIGGKPTVVVTNYPLAYFANRVLADEVPVIEPYPRDVDPSFWQPSDEAVQQLQDARLILMNGANYETWLLSVTLPEDRIVATAKPFADEWISIDEAVTHRHGPGEEHTHKGTATHTWLDPRLAMQQAVAAAEALQKTFPDDAAGIAQRESELLADLQSLDDELATLESLQGEPMWASHPVYQYLGARLGADLKSMHWEPGQVLDETQKQDFLQQQAEHPAAIMLWEGEPAPETRAWLDEQGITCVVYPPCGNHPAEGDWLSNQRSNVQRLREAVSATPSEASGETETP